LTYAAILTQHRFEATLWRHQGDAPWHFVTLPLDLADHIAALAEPKAFGSVGVRARVGTTVWETSLFPDKGSGSYVLPLKRSVRAAESISEGDTVCVEFTVLMPGPAD
jgi:hypothetical protein